MAKFDISNPSGFPEFAPAAEAVRQEWVRVIQNVFTKYGFLPITTPMVEREENLLGKGGNAKEMYALKRVHDETGDTSHSGNALRFDHTVPLALYVARNFNDISFPFKRSVIGPVFRGERAQKGRFRQFDQCDIDIIGNQNLDIKNDALVIAVIVEIFKELGIGDFKVRINNRKILKGFVEQLSIAEEHMKTFLDIIDDIEKSNEKSIKNRLSEIIPSDDGNGVELVYKLITWDPKTVVKDVLEDNSAIRIDEEGFNELKSVLEALKSMGVDEKYYEVDLRIARGLDYYTGTVYETTMPDHPEFGSVCSGGRYDDLASVFTNKNLPGVGISIGLTRLFAQCLDAGIVQPGKASPTEVLLIAADEVALPKLLELGSELRAAGINAENYLENKKLAKQFDYADKLKIPYCVVMGENELAAGEAQVKNMETGERSNVSIDQTVNHLQSEL